MKQHQHHSHHHYSAPISIPKRQIIAANNSSWVKCSNCIAKRKNRIFLRLLLRCRMQSPCRIHIWIIWRSCSLHRINSTILNKMVIVIIITSTTSAINTQVTHKKVVQTKPTNKRLIIIARPYTDFTLLPIQFFSASNIECVVTKRTSLFL